MVLQAAVNSDNVFQGFIEGRDKEHLKEIAQDMELFLYGHIIWKNYGGGYQ